MTQRVLVSFFVRRFSYQGSLPITRWAGYQYTLLRAGLPALADHRCGSPWLRLMSVSGWWIWHEVGLLVFRALSSLLHAVNVSGFWAQETTLVPEDGLNLAWDLSGSEPVSSLSYQIRSVIESQVFSVSDFLIDLHEWQSGRTADPSWLLFLRANPWWEGVLSDAAGFWDTDNLPISGPWQSLSRCLGGLWFA